MALKLFTIISVNHITISYYFLSSGNSLLTTFTTSSLAIAQEPREALSVEVLSAAAQMYECHILKSLRRRMASLKVIAIAAIE